MSGTGNGPRGQGAARRPASYGAIALGRFLGQIAERSPAPGGGSVAAIGTSMAAALVEMSVRFSSADIDDAEEVAARAAQLRVRAGQLADSDAAAYSAVLAAGRASRTPQDRRDARRRALHEASLVPVEVGGIAAEVAEIGARLVDEGNPNLRGDCATGVLLAEAAARAAAHLVALNAAAAGGDELVVRQARRHVERARSAAQAMERALA